MRISVLVVVGVGCAAPATSPPISNTPPPKASPPALAASDLSLDVRASRMPDNGAVRLDYTIKNVSTHGVQVLGALSGTYWYRERYANIKHDGDGPIELRLGAIEGCDCVDDPRGVGGNLPPKQIAFEALVPGGSVTGTVQVKLFDYVELARDRGIVLVVRLANVSGQKIDRSLDVRSEPAHLAR
jgi:hypothetical protein